MTSVRLLKNLSGLNAYSFWKVCHPVRLLKTVRILGYEYFNQSILRPDLQNLNITEKSNSFGRLLSSKIVCFKSENETIVLTQKIRKEALLGNLVKWNYVRIIKHLRFNISHTVLLNDQNLLINFRYKICFSTISNGTILVRDEHINSCTNLSIFLNTWSKW